MISSINRISIVLRFSDLIHKSHQHCAAIWWFDPSIASASRYNLVIWSINHIIDDLIIWRPSVVHWHPHHASVIRCYMIWFRLQFMRICPWLCSSKISQRSSKLFGHCQNLGPWVSYKHPLKKSIMTKTQLRHLFGHQLDHFAQKLQLQHLQASRTSSGQNGDWGV